MQSTNTTLPPPILTFQVEAIEGSDRRFKGVASNPEVDTQNEIVEPAALEEALEAFMALPVVDFFHTGIPVGLITKAGLVGDRLYVEGRIKPTPDCDPVWQGMVDGLLTELSIWGKRTAGSPECSLPPDQRSRSRPCVTKAIQLYTISICPRGSAVNRDAWVMPVGVDESLGTLVQKALTSGSALIHPTVDGATARRKRNLQAEDTMPEKDEKMEEEVTGLPGAEIPPEDVPPTDTATRKADDEIAPEDTTPAEEPTMADIMDVLQKILAAVTAPAEEGTEGEPVLPDEVTEVQKTGDNCIPWDKIKGVKKAADPDKTAGLKDEITKAQNRLLEVETELQKIKAENERLRKAIRPPKEVVIDPTVVSKAAAGESPARKNSRIENLFR